MGRSQARRRRRFTYRAAGESNQRGRLSQKTGRSPNTWGRVRWHKSPASDDPPPVAPLVGPLVEDLGPVEEFIRGWYRSDAGATAVSVDCSGDDSACELWATLLEEASQLEVVYLATATSDLGYRVRGAHRSARVTRLGRRGRRAWRRAGPAHSQGTSTTSSHRGSSQPWKVLPSGQVQLKASPSGKADPRASEVDQTRLPA